MKLKTLIFFILVFFSFLPNVKGQDFKLRKQPFRNYRLCVGAGLGVSPFTMLLNSENSLKPLEKLTPMLSLELVVSQERTLAFIYRSNNFTYQSGPTDYKRGFANLVSFTPVTSTINYQTLRVQLRRYSNFAGHLAPHGRYVSYFLTFNLGSTLTTSAHSYTIQEQYAINTRTYNVSSYKGAIKNAGGLGFALGKKIFMGSNVRRFLELQMAVELNFQSVEDDVSLSDAKSKNAIAFSKASALMVRNTLFQFSARYGFGF